MNRTQDFFNTVEKIKQDTKKNYRVTPRKQIRSPFSIASAHIGKKIMETSEKLERLTQLAKKKGLFDDPRDQIQELSTIINNDIKDLKSDIEKLKVQKRTRNKAEEEHSNTILNTLNTNLKNTTKGFSQVLEMRTQNLKTQQKAQESITGVPFFKAEVPYRRARGYTALPQTDETDEPGEISLEMPASHQQLAVHNSHNSILASRAEAARTIESTIHEIHSIFQQLATMVDEQDVLVTRIDVNVQETSRNVEGIQDELLKYFASISNNRWLYFKLFMVLIVFVIAFVVFFA